MIAQGAWDVLTAVAVALGGWALREVYSLRGALEGLRGRVEAESRATNQRLDELKAQLTGIDDKLALLLRQGCSRMGECRHTTGE